jgi:TRAF3-interacting protein 1
MTEEIEPWVAATQNAFKGVITAPKLTEKLLRKPPFRFLHDIVTNFMKATGFPEGLYPEAMLDSSKVTEKETKLEFLNQLVNVVQIASGKQTSAKPAKIIAGAEPECTNDLLQLLASCAQLPKATLRQAVQTALGNTSEPVVAAQQVAPPAVPAPARPVEQEAPPQDTAPVNPERRSSKSKKEEPKPADPPKVKTEVPTPSPLQQVAGGSERPGTATARKAPPKVNSNEVVESRAEPIQPVAGVIVESKRTANQDSEDGSGEKDWMKLVEEHETAKVRDQAANADEAKGYLGQQALKAKREQEEAARRMAQEAHAGAVDGGIVLNVNKKEKAGSAMAEGELSKLREQLQMLTKASNPLGKFLEAIHEDIDTMSRELEMWRTEARTQAAAARDAQRQTEASLHDIHGRLQNLEDAINDQIVKTNIVRKTILSNDQTIETMVRMVVNPEVGKRK